MAKTTKHTPEGLHSATTQLVVRGARDAIAFYEKAFGATDVHTMPGADGKSIMHGWFRVGDSAIFISDEGGFAKATSSNVFLYVPDVDATVKAAEAAGAKVKTPVADMFWGDRWGMIEDPWGTIWQIATHVEDVSPEEMSKRMKAT